MPRNSLSRDVETLRGGLKKNNALPAPAPWGSLRLMPATADAGRPHRQFGGQTEVAGGADGSVAAGSTQSDYSAVVVHLSVGVAVLG